MVARDPHRFVNELDNPAIDRLIARLESRSRDAAFTRLFDKYATRIDPGPAGQVLVAGCGTGATTRALARRTDFSGRTVGVGQSPHFVETCAPCITKAGPASADTVDAWLAAQRQALADGTFFAACTCHTCLAQRSGEPDS